MMGKEQSLQLMRLGEQAKKTQEFGPLSHTTCKINTKWITGLNIRAKL